MYGQLSGRKNEATKKRRWELRLCGGILPSHAVRKAHKGASEYLVEKTENTRQGAPENIPPN